MLVILSGVSGAGKDTIKKELIKRMDNVISLPSFTSRQPREDEEEGITSRKLMNEKIQSGKIIVKDIEVNGTENLIKLLKNEVKVVPIFLRVEREELKRRLISRGDLLTDEEIELRLGRLDYEESKMNLYDYVIKNDDLEKTVQIIMTIIENEKRLEHAKK